LSIKTHIFRQNPFGEIFIHQVLPTQCLEIIAYLSYKIASIAAGEHAPEGTAGRAVVPATSPGRLTAKG
jgi:hypothetical protein